MKPFKFISLEGEVFKKLEPPAISPDIRPWYYISNYGRVYSSLSDKILKQSLDSKGYPIVALAKYDKKNLTQRIHRMEKLAFDYQEGCEDLEIHHKDSDKTNYKLDNLEWCTKSYNMKQAYLLGEITNLQGEDRVNAKITNEQAGIICERIQSGEWLTRIARDMNLPYTTVLNISNGRAWKSISKDYDFSKSNSYKNRPKNK